MNRELKKQIKRLNKQEEKILKHKKNKYIKSKIDPTINKIKEKIPDKLVYSLEVAFEKGFQLVFEKGYVYVEKTFNKDKVQLAHELNNDELDKIINKKNIKMMDKHSNYSKRFNSYISAIEGSALGVFGIGLPDIPIFIAIIIKTISEIALSYGYKYDDIEEKAYILLLICTSITKEERQKEFNEEVNQLGKNIDSHNKVEVNLEEQIRITANALSEAILTAKFVQGIPIVGVVGGIVNYNIIKKIGKLAGIKYKKRYLLAKTKE